MPHSRLVAQNGPPLVVAPATPDLQVARRKTLAPETRLLGERERALVGGLDVRLDAVQSQLAEREAQRQLHALAHIALPGVRPADPVTHVRVLERAAHD